MLIREDLIRKAFGKIKEEMTDHLDAINENTNEINSVHDYIKHLEHMVSKLNERLDDAELKITELSGNKISMKKIELTPKEKEIFLLLYSRTGDLLDYREISRCIGVTEQHVHKHIEGMITKGIPIVKKYFDSHVYLILDSDFVNLQAKENIVI